MTSTSLFDYELEPSLVTPHPFQREAVEAIEREIWELKRKSTLAILPTGCVAGDTVIGVNRCGKGYKRTIAEAFRLQGDKRIKPWKKTMIRANLGDRIGLHPIQGFVYSGIKETLELKLDNRKSIRVTRDHEVFTKRGWVPAEELRMDDEVACESDPITGRERKRKPSYLMVQGLRYHPFAQGVTSRSSKEGRKPEGRLYRVAKHRLVAEAELNGVSLDEFVDACRNDTVKASMFRFLDPNVWAVHHEDRDHKNNSPSNLEILTHTDHHKEHGETDKLDNLGFGFIEWSKVSHVIPHGYEETYDVVCEDPHRNFVGNGIVVHNCGKTILAGYAIRRFYERSRKNTLFLAHREELVTQAAEKFAAMGLYPVIEMAEQKARHAPGNPHVVVGSVATMQGGRLKQWPKRHFGQVIVDEAHHANCDSHMRVLRHFHAPVIGVTATAHRSDEMNLGLVFESKAFEYTILQAITAPYPGPYLVEPVYRQIEEEIDLSSMRIVGADDYSDEDLREILRPHIRAIANEVKNHIEDRSCLVFTPGVIAATAMASALQSLGLRAQASWGDDPDRRFKVKGFRSGDIQILCGCDVFTEGFDVPRVSMLVMARPTKSWTLLTQMVGRGLRLWPPRKENCLIMDFAWKCLGDHKPLRVANLIAGDCRLTREEEQEVGDEAQRLVETKAETSVLKAVERARADVGEKIRARRTLDLKVEERHRQAAYSDFDPFKAHKVEHQARAYQPEFKPRPASEKQIETLREAGIPVPETISAGRASQMIDTIVRRRSAGLCTLKQKGVLVDMVGLPAEQADRTTFEEASRMISEFKKKEAS